MTPRDWQQIKELVADALEREQVEVDESLGVAGNDVSQHDG